VDCVENAAEIDLDDLIPAGDLELFPTAPGYIETGIVYEQINLTMLCQYRSCNGLDVVHAGDIHGKDVDRSGRLVANALRGIGKHVEAPPGDSDRPAVGCQGLSAGQADADASSGHPGDSFSL
jgi:hypothetical protein